jgi:hypothetical protein
MSFAELKAEIEKLTPAEKKELRDALEARISAPEKAPATMTEYLDSLRGTVILKPGWDEDEPLEDWEALRDNDSSA